MGKNINEKSDWQKAAESAFGGRCPFAPKKLRITKEHPNSPCKVGEIVTVSRWGTFGCWDEKNRWVDFYSLEEIN